MAGHKKNSTLPTRRTLRKFGFRQTLRGALIIGFLIGITMGSQGATYARAYPDHHSRDVFVASLKSAPALGFMAGEIDDALTPASYSIYKSIAMNTLIIAVWGLLVTTRLLRGQEEDGRLEQIVAGRTTKAAATAQLLIGFAYSLAAAFVISWLVIGAFGLDPNVNLSFTSSAILTLAVFLPGFFFASVGVLVSQLALTRGRALAYGLVPLLVLFIIRGAANSIADWNWLKQWSPFGWSDLLNAVRDPHPLWIVPTVICAAICIPLGLYLARKRDLGSSILPQSTYARPHFYLLGSDLQHVVRQNILTFITWCAGTLMYAGLLAAIAKLGADLITKSPQFQHALVKLSSLQSNIAIVFLGLGGLFTALILLVMASVYMGSVRNQEAKGYLDNLLVQPITRTGWLTRRLVVILIMTLVISLLSSYLVWVIAFYQNISLDLGIMFQNAAALMGTIVLLTGIGTAIYGLLPRLASIAMFAVIIWAFLADILKAMLNLKDSHTNELIDKTSLLHYISFTPTKTPDWTQFWWLIGIGIVLMVVGVWRFTQRDIVSE